MIRSVFLAVCILFLLFHCGELGREGLQYHKAREEYEGWKDDTKEKDQGGRAFDFEDLQKRNPDIVAWVRIPDTTIDYPVVQGRDNQYYLNHTAALEENPSGAIFLDAECDPAFAEGNNVLYGHNMRTLTMFGMLKVLYDPSYDQGSSVQAHPDIFIDTPGEEIVYRIFSVRKVHLNHSKDPYVLKFSDSGSWRTYVEAAGRESLIGTGTLPGRETSLLTLSTCTSDSPDGRLMVQAYEIRRRVREKR